MGFGPITLCFRLKGTLVSPDNFSAVFLNEVDFRDPFSASVGSKTVVTGYNLLLQLMQKSFSKIWIGFS